MGGFTTDQILNVAGLAGVMLYLVAYSLLQAGRLRGSSYSYAILNICAASLVLLSLTVAFNLSSAIIQVAWVLISILGIIRLFWLDRSVQFNAEERAFLDRTFPEMPATMARRLLNRGNWIDAEDGAVLLREDEPVTNLYYLSEGKARINSGGQIIGTAISGLLGEMNVLSEGNASAQVQVAGAARLFVISGEAPRSMAARDADFRILLENGMSRDTGRKLMRANQQLSSMTGCDL